MEFGLFQAGKPRPVGYGVTGVTAAGWWLMGTQKNAKEDLNTAFCSVGRGGPADHTVLYGTALLATPEHCSMGVPPVIFAEHGRDARVTIQAGCLCYFAELQAIPSWIGMFLCASDGF